MDTKNTLIVTTPILLTIDMYIGLIRLLEVGPPNAKYNLEERLREGYTDMDWGDKGEIKEAMAIGNNKNNDNKDL